ncbi:MULTISPECIES: antitoxin Xre/MbcA/ParS toxin-binding domain-containing protein [Aquitalea]|uniref:Putative toxin-antitoxin system antitoxin component (TIGR02293 family) n=1 Tax=Aquitalea magnusonii TaxID=332411 RepID=A0A318JM73_9NEIS|nr:MULTISPECIES: antitoxin Xre/MbcA/ParS toxin-binding domain-containing protein [Aquitalea]PXX51011.1 putative toxin-antitoxin system antitoxin component (TIGR02293 family) [Aquitalea magnusonii]
MEASRFTPRSKTTPPPPRRKGGLQLDGLAKLLGQPLHSELELANSVADGLSTSLITNLGKAGLSRSELSFVIPERTLSHRIRKGEQLSRDESERGVRLANLLLLAEQVLGEQEIATAWLRQPLQRFAGASPLDTARTEQGARLVEALLLQIDEGYVA